MGQRAGGGIGDPPSGGQRVLRELVKLDRHGGGRVPCAVGKPDYRPLRQPSPLSRPSTVARPVVTPGRRARGAYALVVAKIGDLGVGDVAGDHACQRLTEALTGFVSVMTQHRQMRCPGRFHPWRKGDP